MWMGMPQRRRLQDRSPHPHVIPTLLLLDQGTAHSGVPGPAGLRGLSEPPPFSELQDWQGPGPGPAPAEMRVTKMSPQVGLSWISDPVGTDRS